MDNNDPATDEQAVMELDRSWNEVYYVRVYSKRETGWQAVFVAVFPVITEATTR
jgi:hypothetical protein